MGDSWTASIVGDFRARQIEVLIGSALILVVAYLLVGWLRRYPNSVIRFRNGPVWPAKLKS